MSSQFFQFGQFDHTLSLQLCAAVPDDAYNEIDNLVNEISDQFHLSASSHLLNRIPLLRFTIDESFFPMCETWLQRFSAQWKPFILQLNNFSGVPPHTIYARGMPYFLEQQTQSLNTLASQLSGFTYGNIEINTHWHYPIFDKVPGMLFDKVLSAFASTQFKTELVIDKLQFVKTSEEKALRSFLLVA